MFKGDIKKIEERLKSIKAVHIMSRFAITTKDNESVSNLAHVMMRFKISGVPVVDKNGEICGIVTATDLFSLMRNIVQDIETGEDHRSYKDLKVEQIMTKDVVNITEETSLYEIVRIMCIKNIHTLPVMVVSKKEIVGVIGRRDIINAFYVGLGTDFRKE